MAWSNELFKKLPTFEYLNVADKLRIHRTIYTSKCLIRINGHFKTLSSSQHLENCVDHGADHITIRHLPRIICEYHLDVSARRLSNAHCISATHKQCTLGVSLESISRVLFPNIRTPKQVLSRYGLTSFPSSRSKVLCFAFECRYIQHSGVLIQTRHPFRLGNHSGIYFIVIASLKNI